MPRVCTVCSHPERVLVDKHLVEGLTFRTIADRTGLSLSALKRHKQDHIPVKLASAQEAAQVTDSNDLLDQVKALRSKSLHLLTKAEEAGDIRTALAGVREARACIELLLEVEGELDRRNVLNVTMSSDWIEIRAVLLDSLEPYPEASRAVSAVLAKVGRVQHGD